MKRIHWTAATIGLALLVTLGLSASAAAPAVERHTAMPAATDDTPPVECPFCGGDATLHVRRMNNIAVISSRIAYRVLDATLF